MKNIYVGNLPYNVTEETLRELFEEHGAVESVRIMVDKFTGRPRGFGFVSMPNDDEATKAVQALNLHILEGRNLRVSEANEQRPRREGGGGGREGGFGGRRRFGGHEGGGRDRF